MLNTIEPYRDFLKKKLTFGIDSGFDISVDQLNKNQFEWQKVITRWGLKKGKCAFFLDTGLGKTISQLSWSDEIYKETKSNILVYAPLAVSHQTIREGEKFGIKVHRCDSQNDVKPGINITNYQRIHQFDAEKFGGVVLDESSFIKDWQGKFRNELIDRYRLVPYKLCCSATPSPNDYMELGSTSTFLGLMTQPEMLSTFFINDTKDTGTWRLKGHVEKNKFWEWIASWAVVVKKPSDIGFSDEGYNLPPLNYIEHIIPYKGHKNGIFVQQVKGLNDLRQSLKETMEERCKLVADIVNRSDNSKIWSIWCNYNDESALLTKLIRGAVEVSGSVKDSEKVKRIIDFFDGKTRALVTKPQIAGHGINLQICHDVVLTGLTHSFEKFYQTIRRHWRFGQKHEVNVHLVMGERERSVYETVRQKEAAMESMFNNMRFHMKDLVKKEIFSTTSKALDYNPTKNIVIPKWFCKK
jgi:hypothetical protein